MNESHSGNEPIRTLDRGECIRSACAVFQSALESNQSVSLEAVLSSVPKPWLEAAFAELLRIELAHFERSGSGTSSADDYARRFPDFVAAIQRVLADCKLLLDTDTFRGSSRGDTPIAAFVSLPTRDESLLPLPVGEGRGEGVFRTLGRFELLETLGEGSYGTVYRAHDPQLDREVAIKIPRAGTLHDDRAAQRFLREARAAAQLRHPNIVPIHDAGQIDGTYYIASGFIKGRTLREAMKSRAATNLPSPSKGEGSGVRVTGVSKAPAFSQREAATLIAKLAAALHYAHTQGIIHRDIKPENIMVDESGEPHVMDFGLARREEGEEHRTREGTVMGTAAYMSPEQARGESHLADARSDLWSLGVVLYELLTGRRPFTAKSFESLMLEILQREPTPPRKLKPSIAKDLDTIVQKCLTKESTNRSASCGQLAEELGRFLRGEPITSRRITPLERTWRWAKRHPALATLSTALLVLITSAAIIGPLVAVRQATLKNQAEQLAKEKEGLLTDKSKALENLAKANRAQREANDNLTQANVKQRETLLRQYWEHAAALATQRRAREATAVLGELFAAAPNRHRLKYSAREMLTGWAGVSPLIFVHDGPVLKVVFSPDGKCVLTGGDDNMARLWDAATGQPVGEPMKHEGRVESVAFGPDGRSVLTGSSDNTARLWDARTGQPIGQPMKHENGILSVAFSPNGDSLLTGSHDSTARLWDARTGRSMGKPMKHDGSVWSVAFSPDGGSVLTGSWDHTARLWTAHTGEPIGEPIKHDNSVSLVAFSPDGNSLFTGSDLTARLWDCRTAQLVGQPMKLQGIVMSAAFNPDGTWLLTGSGDGKTQLWDARTAQPIGQPLKHDGGVVTVAFSPSGDSVLTGSEDRTAQLWDARTGQPTGKPLKHQNRVLSVAFSPDGDSVLTGSEDRTARLWDLRASQPIALMKHDGPLTSVAFSPDGDSVLTGSWDHTARLWDARTGEPIGEPMKHEKGVLSLAFSPDGGSVLTGSMDHTARLWDARTGEPIGEPMEHEERVWSVAFSPDGGRVLTGSWDETARLWNARTGQTIGEPMRHESRMVVAFSPDGGSVLTGSWDRTARLWDARTGQPIGEPMKHDDFVGGVAFSPDGGSVLTGSEDTTARLWDVRTNKPLGNVMQHENRVWLVAFSPNGGSVLTGSWDHTARLWDARTGQPIGEAMQHEREVLSVAFSPDGGSVLTGSADDTARLWDARTGQPIGESMKHDGDVESVAFSPDGDSVLTGCADRAARVFRLPQKLPKTVPFIAAWTRVRTGMEVDSSGNLRTLTQEEWLQAWANLEKVADYLTEERRRWDERAAEVRRANE